MIAWLVSSTKVGAQPSPTEAPPPTPVESPAAAAPPAAPAPPGTYVAPAYPSPPPVPYAAPAYAPQPAGVYVAAPPPIREQDEPGGHLHDGFYLRMALGAGWLGMRLDSPSEVDLRGSGGSLDLLLGGTPIDGLVIGGGIFSASATDPRMESGGKSSELAGQTSAVVVGPFVDGFFDAAGGLHVGGAIGLSALTVKPDDGDSGFDEEPYNGAGVALFAGYDAWVSANWSLGGYLRFIAARGQRDLEAQNGTVRESARAYAFSILFSALYH